MSHVERFETIQRKFAQQHRKFDLIRVRETARQYRLNRISTQRRAFHMELLKSKHTRPLSAALLTSDSGQVSVEVTSKPTQTLPDSTAAQVAYADNLLSALRMFFFGPFVGHFFDRTFFDSGFGAYNREIRERTLPCSGPFPHSSSSARHEMDKPLFFF